MPDTNPLFNSERLEEVLGAGREPPPAAEEPMAQPPAGQTASPLMYDPAMGAAERRPTREEYKAMPATEVAGRAIKALPGSAMELGRGMVEPFYPENIPQTLQSAGDIAAGGVSKAAGALGFEQDPAEKARTEAALNALVTHFGDRYGSMEGVKQALAEDPAGVMADLSSIMTLGGGAAARLPGVIGTAGRVTRAAGELAGPITGPAKVVGAASKAISPAVNFALSGLSGTSFKSLQEAAKSGVTGDKTFWNSLSGNISPADVVGDVSNAISQIAQDRSAAYLSGMSALKASKPLSFGAVDAALNRAKSTAQFGTININQTAAQAIAEMEAKVNEWKTAAAADPMYQGIGGFDALKRAIDDIAATNYRGTPADKAVEIVRNGIKAEIERADPNYAKVMESYSEATQNLADLRKELTAGNRGAVGQNLRKLLRSLNDKHKNDLLKDLAAKDPDIFAKIAGQEVAHAHGHSGGVLQLGGLLSLLLQDPKAFGAAVPAAVLGSPGIAARTAYGTRLLSRAPEAIGEGIGTKFSPLVAGAELGRERVENRTGRATGGGVRAITAQQLIGMAEAAKRGINGHTKELLKAPDEHVVRALDIASKHI